jgi:glutathione S-transferase
MAELELILHHYPTSPFAEKARLGLGLKGLDWRSVTIPVIMPKPDLVALTGGYRKTPVLQIGADIYCDTALILRELERRFPEPSFYPGACAGAADVIAAWADKQVFPIAVGTVFATQGERVPQDFRDDRAQFSGRDFDPVRMKAALPNLLDQLRGQIDLLDRMLQANGPFLLGAKPSIADLAAYHPLWFIPDQLGKTIPPLSNAPKVIAWMARVAQIGHGQLKPMLSTEALAVARGAKPEARPRRDVDDPNQREPNTKVSVCPDDTGRDPVVGLIVSSSVNEIVIAREDTDAGLSSVHVHFPRMGFGVRRMQ